jgi:hypothetical protein
MHVMCHMRRRIHAWHASCEEEHTCRSGRRLSRWPLLLFITAGPSIKLCAGGRGWRLSFLMVLPRLRVLEQAETEVWHISVLKRC